MKVVEEAAATVVLPSSADASEDFGDVECSF